MRNKTYPGWGMLLLVSAVVVGVLAAACGGSGDSPPTLTDTEGVTGTPATKVIASDAGSSATSSDLSGDSTTTSTTTTAQDAEAPEPAGTDQLEPVVLPQTTAVYFRTRGGASSDTLKAIVNSPTGEMLGSKFITIESTSSALAVFSPDTGDTVVFHTYSSPSYSKRTKRPFTVDDRLYLETEYSSGRLDLVEYNLKNLAVEGSGDTELLRKTIIGDTHYYYDYPEHRGILGYYGNLEFVKEPLSGAEATRRIVRPKPESTEGHRWTA